MTLTRKLLDTEYIWWFHNKREYSAPPEPGVRRVRATIPVGQSQCSGQ